MKKILTIVAAILLAIGWSVRFYAVNQNVDTSVLQIFPKGEEVPVGKDFFNYADEEMNGYTVTVLDSKLYSAADFLQEYNAADQAELLGTHTDYIYSVRVCIANRDNPYTGQKGISLQQYALQGTDYILSFEDTCYQIANPDMPGASFSLQQGTSIELMLTFDVISQNTDIKHLSDDPPKLLITQYPHQKMIEIL